MLAKRTLITLLILSSHIICVFAQKKDQIVDKYYKHMRRGDSIIVNISKNGSWKDTVLYSSAIIEYSTAGFFGSHVLDLDLGLEKNAKSKIESARKRRENLIYELNGNNSSLITPNTLKLSKQIIFFPKNYISLPRKNSNFVNEIQDFLANIQTGKIYIPQNKFIEEYENRLYGVNYKYYDRNIYDSVSKLLKISGNNDDIVYLYLRSAMYYAWDKIDEKKWAIQNIDTAIKVINKAINTISKNQQKKSDKIYFAFSGIENLISYYFFDSKDILKSDEHSKRAIYYAKKAIEINPANAYYLRGLYLNLSNLRERSDSILSEEQKKSLLCAGDFVSSYMKLHVENKFIAVNVEVMNTIAITNDLNDKKKYVEAISRLVNTTRDIESHISDQTYFECGPILLAKLYNEQCYYYRQLNDTIGFKLCVRKSIENLALCMNRKISSQRVLDELHSVFDYVRGQIDDLYDNTDRLSSYNTLINSIENSSNNYLIQKDMSYVHTNSSTALCDLYMKKKTHNDTILAIYHLSNAITLFYETDFLKYYSNFSEDYAKFCSIYNKAVRIYVGMGNYPMAKKYYDAMRRTFDPILKKYRYDFYLSSPMIGASDVYGSFLYGRGLIDEAIPVLEFASYEGIYDATRILTKIYSDSSSSLYNSVKAGIYIDRIAYQSSGMKRFTVPCDFSGVKVPFDVYVSDRAKGYPYLGIDDQAQWIETAKKGKVPDDVVESFRKLQKIAWDNDVSFQDLCVYALGAAQADIVTDKYKEKKEAIKKEERSKIKLELYADLYKIYENDIRNDSPGKADILKNAIPIYIDYAKLLTNSDDTKALKVYRKVLRYDSINYDAKIGIAGIDYSRDKRNVQNLIKKTDVQQLKTILALYLNDKDQNNSNIVLKRIFELKDDAQTRYDVSKIYLLTTSDNNFERLFLYDKSRIGEYLSFYIDIEVNKLSSETQILYYTNLIQLDRAFLDIMASDKAKLAVCNRLLSSHLNSLAWQYLLTKKYDHVLDYLNESKKIDSTNKYPDGNMPHYYLLTGQYGLAKKNYLALKNKPFEKERYPTYKKAFLADFDEFEKVGITNEHFTELRKLLK